MKDEAESFASQGFQPEMDAFPAFPPLSALRPGEPLANPSGMPPSAPQPYGFDQAAPYAAPNKDSLGFLQSQDGPFGFDSSLFQPEDVKNFSLGSLYQDEPAYYQNPAPPPESFKLPATDGFTLDPYASFAQQLPQSFDPNLQLPQGFDPNLQLPQGFDPNLQLPQGYDPNLQLPQSFDPTLQFVQPKAVPNPLDAYGFEPALFQPEDIKDFSLGSIYPNDQSVPAYTEPAAPYPSPIAPDGPLASYFPDPAEIYKQTVLGKMDPSGAQMPEYAFSQAELERRAMLETLYPSVPQVTGYSFDPDEIYRQALVGKVGSVEGHGQEFSYPNGKPGSADFSHFEYSEMLPPDGQPRAGYGSTWRQNSGDPYANARQALKGTFDPDEGSKKNYPFVESPWLAYGDRPQTSQNPQIGPQEPGPFATGKEDDGKNAASSKPKGNTAKKGKKPPFDAPPGSGSLPGKPSEQAKKKPKLDKGGKANISPQCLEGIKIRKTDSGFT
jgi:hypothetical protein